MLDLTPSNVIASDSSGTMIVLWYSFTIGYIHCTYSGSAISDSCECDYCSEHFGYYIDLLSIEEVQDQ